MQVYKAKKYIRLSHIDDKDGKGKRAEGESNSVSNQRKMIDSFIAANDDIEDCGEKVDDGYSGIIFDRPAFIELMDEVRAGEINCVIVKDLSRLGREYIETGRYLRRIFPAYGVRFIAINDNIDTAKGTAGDDMMVSFKSVVNDAYCRDISVKTRSALASKRENGDYVGACPVYGYVKDEENKNRLVKDEYAAAIVREIYRMRIDGLSAAAIAEELNQRGVLSPLEYKKDRGLPHPKKGFADKAGAQWAPIAVIRILGDETYTGTLVQGKQGAPNYKVREIVERPVDEWVRTENAHEPIISKTDFDIVQRLARLDTRSASSGRPVHLFSGLLICGCCGAFMTRKTVSYKGKRYFYYHCPTGKKNGCSHPVMIKESELAECVLESMKAHIANIASLDKILSTAQSNRAMSAVAKRYRAQIEENQRRLAEAAAFKTGLCKHLINGDISKADYKDLKESYAEDARRLENAVRKLTRELDDILAGGSERQRWIERFGEVANLTELDRRTVAYLIHSIRVVGKAELEITFNYQPEYGKSDGEVA